MRAEHDESGGDPCDLLGLLEEEMGEPFPSLADDQDLRESLGLDSVDLVGLVMRIEREFRIRLAPESFATVKHVGDLLDLVTAKVASRPSRRSMGNRASRTEHDRSVAAHREVINPSRIVDLVQSPGPGPGQPRSFCPRARRWWPMRS